MNITINAKQLRASLPKLVESVRQGARYTVLYRGRRAFQIVPVDEADMPAPCKPISSRTGGFCPSMPFASLGGAR
jgi:antitoxin (DNA-binding transcriptional repressor) of toxin-antitoxin stability system